MTVITPLWNFASSTNLFSDLAARQEGLEYLESIGVAGGKRGARHWEQTRRYGLRPAAVTEIFDLRLKTLANFPRLSDLQ
jgi:hypothetical protein